MNPKQVRMLRQWIEGALTDNMRMAREGQGNDTSILKEIEDIQTLRRMIEKNFRVDLGGPKEGEN